MKRKKKRHEGSGFRAYCVLKGLEFRVDAVSFEFEFLGLRFKVQVLGLGFKGLGLGFRA